MEQFAEGESTREEIKNKLRQNFDGKIVRKDLTKKIKEGANVPVYVLEFLLGQYCSSDDETVIEKGVQNVKRILADNFVRPDESQKILSQLRKKGSHTIIDNFGNETEIKKALGPAMFSRIGSCIEYADLTVEQKQIIINNWYSSILKTLQEDEKDFIQNTDVHEWFIKNAGRYDNIRILKGKMENAIFEKLTEQFIISK